jgi:hypothetical protein
VVEVVATGVINPGERTVQDHRDWD